VEETGGHVTTVDRESAVGRDSNIYEMLDRISLRDRLSCVLIPGSSGPDRL
jgi:hypothetical protein